ncbi:hypothetical protein FSP39_019540 [Pinctada imbricata]|uniref:Uncharacterized protein n=1 Tax=Pinctada imbricata TaxID=66713 RepID=A0AA89C7T4_PINIB|nr:hypothetical protein FSP39_019540 [Pinctada imbricata]
MIASSGVIEPFLDVNIRYHHPIVAILHHVKHSSNSFKRKIWLYDQGNYDNYRSRLSQVDWDSIIDQAESLDDSVGVRLVYIGQLIRRLPFTVCTGYNEMVVQTNINLEAMTKHVAGVEFWHHRGFWASLAYLGPDGVHLDCTPSHSQQMRKYLRSIRNAVIQAPKFLRPV